MQCFRVSIPPAVSPIVSLNFVLITFSFLLRQMDMESWPAFVVLIEAQKDNIISKSV